MFYYKILPLKHNLQELTYYSKIPLKIGQIVEVELINKIIHGVVFLESNKPNFECKEAVASEYFISKIQLSIAEFIASYYFATRAISYGLFTPFKNKDTKLDSIEFKLQSLSQAQNLALNFIKDRQSTLLFGDTGSGKTEIYIHLINEALKNRQNAIFLMPEISLTPQMEKRLKAVFGDILAFWHSKVSTKKKNEILNLIYDNKIRILAGARSALFLPMHSLGLIIIDEEHDDAYKSSSNPTYHARDVALYLAQKHNIKILLGSATPSLSTYYRFKENNSMYRLKGTYYNSNKKFIFCENSDDTIIINSLQNTIDSNNQAIVFLPTRANFKYLICKSCSTSIHCPNCSVGMSLHLKNKKLKCHYCQHTQEIPQRCPCGGELSSQRIGTQEYVKYLQSNLKDSKIQCFDRDEITTQKKLTHILNEFNKRKIDILVGTQMLSKGHDYHNVKLSVILGIDYIAQSCDYRANEKAMSLLMQLAGRSGRKDSGLVLIQSKNKEYLQNYLQDYESFLKDELLIREHLYPPYMRLALIKISHTNKDKAILIMEKLVSKIKQNIKSKTTIVGYGESPIQKLSNKWRFNIMLRSKEAKNLHDSLLVLRGENCIIDIDPIDFA